MKERRVFPALIMLALSLTSCAGKNSDKVVAINGDLFSLNEITYENACYDVNFTEMNTLINSGEKFVFYLTSSQCSHFSEFQDKIANYIKKTNTMVYRMDIIDKSGETYSTEFEQLFEAYKEYFFINDQVLTPQVYIVEGKKVAEQVPASRYAQKWMFKRAMSEYVRTGKVYSFKDENAFNKFKEERTKKEYFTIYTDKSSELYSRYSSVLKGAKKDVAVLDSLLGPGMYATHHLADGSIEEYTFSENQAENDTFINKCLN